jgi:putative lipoic acid-binding regulatory protein
MTDTTQPESPLEFPCDFPIKALGRAASDFDARIVSLIRRHVPDLAEGAVTVRRSRHANYLAVTVVVRATSRAQLDAIYEDLSASDQVLVAF